MPIIKTREGTYRADISIARGKRHRKTFKTKNQAARYELEFLNGLENRHIEITKNDNKTLLELIELWKKLHGVTLKDIKNRLSCLQNMAREIGNPLVKLITPTDFLNYRAIRLKNRKPKTVNNEITYMKSVFSTLISYKEISFTNPLENIKPIKISESSIGYLELDEIDKLLKELKTFTGLYHATLIALQTGARWGEIQRLKPQHYKNEKITFTDTKGKRNRTIPCKISFQLPLKNLNPKIFARCYKQANITKYIGANTHILRHTFSSWFMINGGNILVLQKILDHTKLETTMRYAHLAPDHLKEALIYNPVVKMLSNFDI